MKAARTTETPLARRPASLAVKITSFTLAAALLGTSLMGLL
ncbi:hypothetical protein [Arthrobacter sp. zg-Y1110]|nr:hypothetical protein [Arthrobacter sp. zg-Y1110]UWX86994.1 hypothetical protein N2K99_16725 [Arthrobacter sp. zg-Y1110]